MNDKNAIFIAFYSVQLTLFSATIAEGISQKLEHNDIRWIAVDEVSQYEFCPADMEILRMLKEKKCEQ